MASNKALILIAISTILLVNSYVNTRFVDSAKEAHWAVLVAGSNGFGNYRHQADICHAYQILRKNGLAANRIIVMSYNDAAKSSLNKFPGQLFNKPDPNGKGVDVNDGCIIDYEGKDVTPLNFLNILVGKTMTVGTKRTLESTKDDNVFIYFADHGAAGLIAFPSKYLYADDLNNTLVNMNKMKKYHKLVFYLEACESGSMFPNLPTNINIFATTAANAVESSWATYCYPDDVINGVHVTSCLGDDYSVRWMEDTEAQNMKKAESLEQQFETVKNLTAKSHPLQFGDLSVDTEPISNYQAVETKLRKEKLNLSQEYLNYLEEAKKSLVDSRDHNLHYLYNRVMYEDDSASQELLKTEVDQRIKYDTIFANFDLDVSQDPIIDFKCLKATVENFKQTCMEITDYGLKYVKHMAKLCQTKTEEEINNMFTTICKA